MYTSFVTVLSLSCTTGCGLHLPPFGPISLVYSSYLSFAAKLSYKRPHCTPSISLSPLSAACSNYPALEQVITPPFLLLFIYMIFYFSKFYLKIPSHPDYRCLDPSTARVYTSRHVMLFLTRLSSGVHPRSPPSTDPATLSR